MLWGCASLGTLQTADTVKAGHGRWNFQGVLQGAEGRKPLSWFPQGAIEYRHGLVDGLDLGGKLGTAGGEASVKVRLVKSEGSPWLVSLMPTAGLVYVSQSRQESTLRPQFYAALPIIVGHESDGGSQLVLALRPTWMDFGVRNDERDTLLGMGASVGYAFRLGPSVRLMPEVAVLVPVADLTERSVGIPDRTSPNLQVGLAFLLDP